MIALGLITTFALGLTFASWLLKPTPVGPPGAPHPSQYSEAVVQVYGANVWGIRGRFAIHTWIAMKPRGADAYTKYQVIGWRQRRGLPVVSVSSGRPDTDWFGAPPILLADLRGAQAQALIPAIEAAVASYPYADEYVMWPGPNSNSFTAWIALEVPELELDLPAKAIGESWMRQNHPTARR